MNLSDEQQLVADQIDAFLSAKRVRKPYFVLHGAAGTGKTVILSEIAKRRPNAAMCAYTGKAASVLSRKTDLQATTIHSILYLFRGVDDETQQPIFSRAVDDGEWDGNIVLLDECSMCDSWISQDLLNTGCRVIACGDPGQLPPVRGEPFFHTPDAVLKTVHRQAWDSPIIRQAHAVRAGQRYGADGDAFRVSDHATAEDVLEADMLLCWRNATRMQLNTLKRMHLGLHGTPLRAGEPVMCLKNDHKNGVLNGALYTLLEDHQIGSGKLAITNERGHDVVLKEAWIEGMEGPRPALDDNKAHPFAIGYAATVHKSQGSEWDNVLLVDEYGADREDWARWAYTGITRAAKRVLVKI